MGTNQNPFGIHPEERTALFIDGSNLYSSARLADLDVDYKKLHEHFATKTRLTRALYYTAIASEESDYSPIRPLVDWLSYNNYSVVTKPLIRSSNYDGQTRYRGSINVEMTIDMIELAPRLDHVLLFTNDGDLRASVQTVKRLGNRVTVVGGVQSRDMSDDLRREADTAVDILGDSIKALGITKPRAPRAQDLPAFARPASVSRAA